MQNNFSKRLAAVLLAGVLSAGMLMSGCGAFNKKTESSETSSSTSKTETSAQRTLTGEDVVSSENYALSKQIVSYLYNNYYNSNLQYATYLGLDVTKSLKDQYYDSSNTITWYDYFMNMTKQYLTQLFVLSEAAKAENITLDDKDMESVDTTVNSIKSAAESAGMKLDEYITKNFGEGVNETNIRQYLEMTALANKYYDKLYESYKYTDEDYENYYSENKTSYLFADFLRFKFSFANNNADTSTGASSAPAVDKDVKDKAKAYADSLAKCKTAKEFKAFIKKYYEDNKNLLPVQEGEKLTDEEIAKLIDDQVDAAQIKKYAYEVTSQDGKWVFDVSREASDIASLESDTAYTVIMVTKPAYRDESFYKKVRHILITPKSFGGNEANARKKAEEIYDEWKKGDATEESFAALAERYSEDPGSKSNGGLYDQVGEGDMVAEFNDWLFDANRKVGDSGIVKTTYGYHIMYFSGNGDMVWKKSVDTVMRKNQYNEDYAKLAEKYAVTFDDVYLNTIEESEMVNETSEESSTATDESSVASETTSTEESKTSEASKASGA